MDKIRGSFSMFFISFLLINCGSFLCVNCDEIVDNIDTRNYLLTQNPIWLDDFAESYKVDNSWYDNPFNGNGRIGILCYSENMNDSSNLIVKVSDSSLFTHLNDGTKIVNIEKYIV